MNQLNKDHTFKPNRDADMQTLIQRLHAYGLPTSWRTVISESSIVVTSPNRTRSIKFDAYRTVTVDVIRGLNVKSSVFTLKTLDEMWKIVEQTLNANVPRKPAPEALCPA